MTMGTMRNTTRGSHSAAPDLSKCPRALFLQPISGWAAIVSYFVLMGISIAFCIWLQDLATKPAVPTPPTPETQPPAVPEHEAPPPYEPPAEATAASTTLPKTPKKKRSRASAFVLGTFVFILLLLTMFAIALCIQNLHYCHDDPGSVVGLAVVFWAWYAMMCGLATLGFSSWLILLRNLGGKKAVERWPMTQFWMLIGLGVLLAMPFVLVGWVVKYGLELIGTPLVSVVESLQRRLCGDEAVEDDDEEGIRLEEGQGMLPEEGQGLLQEATGSDSGERRESLEVPSKQGVVGSPV